MPEDISDDLFLATKTARRHLKQDRADAIGDAVHPAMLRNSLSKHRVNLRGSVRGRDVKTDE